MSLKHKVVLGPIAKYKKYGKLIHNINSYRQVSLEINDMCRSHYSHIYAGHAFYRTYFNI